MRKVKGVIKIEDIINQISDPCELIQKYLEENRNPYTEVSITTDEVRVKETIAGIPRKRQEKQTNHEVLKQMPINSFANMIYTMATRDCKTLQEFEALLRREFPEEGKRALQDLQCP